MVEIPLTATVFSQHAILRGRRDGVPRPGIGVQVVDVSDVQVIGGTAGVGIHQARGVELNHEVRHLGRVKHAHTVALVEHLHIVATTTTR